MASSSSAKLPDTPDTSGLGRISKNVLAMGFMRRSAMKLEQQQQQAASLNNNNSSPINALLFGSSPKTPFSPAAKSKPAVRVHVAGTTRFIKPEDTDDEEEVNKVKHPGSDGRLFIHPTAQKADDPPDYTLRSPVLVEERYTVLEDLRFGRFSFKGQNPAVEKLMIYYECKRMGIEPPSDNDLLGPDDQMEEGEIGEEEEEFEISGDRKHQLASTICGRFSARKAPKFGRPDKKMRRKGKGKGGIVKKKKRVASGKASQQGKAHEKRRLGR